MQLNRIVCVAAGVSDTLDALGLRDRLVATSAPAPEEDHLPTFSPQDTASILAVRPDLVILDQDASTDPIELLRAGVRTLVLAPHTLNEVFADMLLLGQLFNRPMAATRLVQSLHDELHTLATQAVPPCQVYCEEQRTPPTAARQWISELLALAGAIDVVEDLSTRRDPRDRQVSAALMRERAPEVILVAWHGAGSRGNPGEIATREGWHRVPAVLRRRIIGIDDRLLQPGPRLVDGLRALIVALQQTQRLAA